MVFYWCDLMVNPQQLHKIIQLFICKLKVIIGYDCVRDVEPRDYVFP